jgi:O-antigen/teichoic acid export membrane protein
LINKFRSFLGRSHNIRAHFWQSLANYTQSGGGMILGIVLARLLSPDVFGEFVLINASLGLLMIAASFSTDQILVKDAGKKPELFKRVLGMAVFISFLKLSLLVFYLLLTHKSSNNSHLIIAAIIGIPHVFSDCISVIKSDLEGRGKFKPNFIVQTVDLFAHAFVAITLILNGYGIYGLALGGLSGFILKSSVYLKVTDRNLFQLEISPPLFVHQFKIGFWLWLNQTCEGMMYRLDKLVVGKYSSSQDLGLYNRAYNFAPISQLLLNSLMANATVVGLANCQTKTARNQLFLKTSALVFLGGALNWALWWWFSNPLVVWIFGPNWAGAVPLFESFSFLSLAWGFFYMPTALLLSQGHYRSLALCKLFGITMLILLLLYFYHQHHISPCNVALSLMVSIFTSGLVLIVIAARKSII